MVEILFGIILIAGGIWIYRKKPLRQRYRLPAIALTFLLLWSMAYFTVISIVGRDFLVLAPLGLLGIFFVCWKREKRSVFNGLWFNLFLVSYFLLSLYLQIEFPSLISGAISGVGLMIYVLILVFGFLALIGYLFGNARVILKRERVQFSNMLTLFAGIFLLGFELLKLLLKPQSLPWYASGLLASSTFVLGYYYFLFATYLTSTILFNLYRPAFNKKYVIVLGAWLLGGKKVTPLLRARIQRAIDFARQQEAITGVLPKLVMSGGKGSDELVSEAFAMCEEAVALGFPREAILLEDRSTTTLENLRFAKEIMANDSGMDNPPAVISTNNYHLFRAGIYARQAGVNADGIGAPTARYYIPNGFLREFVAYVVMHKWFHFIMAILIVIATLVHAYLDYILKLPTA